ncbi:MAG: T9SS type A sorting domain-containing protein [Saprospiraceae bacterium]|nr:T9SS type A sorting domain-containing protein [Saprospiraceae bacterium]
MKFSIPTILCLLFLSLSIHAQPCLTTGITFTAQSQIDNFTSANPNCTQIGGNVTIQGTSITNLNNLSAIESIGGDLYITSNDVLVNLTGLNNLEWVGGAMRIQNNPALANIDGLENLAAVRGDYFYIANNPPLNSISGLSDLDSVGGIFQIWSQVLLTNLNGLEDLKFVDQALAIFENSALTSLDGLNSLDFVGDALRIYENEVLTNLDALNHPVEIQGALVITDNAALGNCAVEAVCEYLLSPSSFVAISDNASGCNSDDEVFGDCISATTDAALSAQIKIIPNPVSDMARVSLENTAIDGIQVRDALGRLVFCNPKGMDEVNLSNLASGVYFFEILSEGKKAVKRVVKQ